ncbi:Piwi-domain-containing protein, partial [Aureobasidium melanogenum]
MPRQPNDRLPYRGKQNVSFMISRTLPLPQCTLSHLHFSSSGPHSSSGLHWGQFDARSRHRRGGGSSRGDRDGCGFRDRGRDGGGHGREGFRLPIHSGPFDNGIFPRGSDPWPNQEVQALEDPRVRNTIEQFSRHSSHDVKGHSIELHANHLHWKTAFKTGKRDVLPLHGATSTARQVTVVVKSEKLGLGLAGRAQSKIGVPASSDWILVNLNVASAASPETGPLMNLVSELAGSHCRQSSAPQDLSLDTNGKPKKNAQDHPQTVPSSKSIVGLTSRLENGGTRTLTSSPTRLQNSQAAPCCLVVFLHFRNQHATTLQRPALPAVKVGTRSDPSYLPIELATVLTGQPVSRSLSGSQAEYTLQSPAGDPRLSATSIAASPGNRLRTMGFDEPAQIVDNFGTNISKELTAFPCCTLPTPRVYYVNKELQAREGSWNLINVKFSKPGSFGSWACVVINYNDQRGNALLPEGAQMQSAPVLGGENTLKALRWHLGAYRVCMGSRLQTQDINIARPNERNREVVDKKFKEIFSNAELHDIELLFVVLQEYGKWLYSRIKLWGYVGLGVHSICSVGSKIQKPEGQDMFPGNLALQFNGNNKSAGVNQNKPSNRAEKQKARDERIRNALLQDVVDNGGKVPENMKPQLQIVRKKTAAQKAMETEILERNPEIIKELKDVKKQISDLEARRNALQQELDDNKKTLSLIPKDTVSITLPAYYADLICERGRMYLYSILNENQGADAVAYNAQTAGWTHGVHSNLREKTFYI